MNNRRITIALIVVICLGGAFALLGFMGYTFTDYRSPRGPSAHELEKAASDLKDELRRKLQQTGELSVEDREKALGKMRDVLDQAANSGGGASKPAKIMLDFIGEFQAGSKPYHEFAQRMAKEDPFDVAAIKSKEDLARRREIAKELQTLTRDLSALVDGSRTRFTALLERERVKGIHFDQAMLAFDTSFGKALPRQRRARAADQVLATSLLELCDLLEVEWGKWKFAGSSVEFETESAIPKFNGIMQRVAKAVEEQMAAQREIFGMK